MLTRALMLNPFPQQAPSRTTGRYLGLNGQMYNIVWDPATSRLLVYRLGGSFTEIQTAVSSQAQAAVRTATGRVGISNVGQTGVVGSPIADYAYPATPTGYALHSIAANADVLFTGNATGTQGGFSIRNMATGVSSGAIAGYAGVSTRERTYSTGDAWLTQIPQDTGLSAGAPYSIFTQNGRRVLRVIYGVISPAYPVLGRIGAPSITPIPMTGIPRILASANTVRAVTMALDLAATAQCRAGKVLIPARVTTQEIDVQGTTVSVAEADWYGYVEANATSSTFMPLSAYFGSRIDVPCTVEPQSDGSTIYRPTGADFMFTKVGAPNLALYGILPGTAALWRMNGSSDPVTTATLPAHIKTVRTADGSTIVDADVGSTIDPPTALFALPHIGALVRWRSGQFVDTAIIQISFDGGLTWQQATAFQSQLNNGQPTIRGASYENLRAAIPLFIV